jgi:hypothetical protein
MKKTPKAEKSRRAPGLRAEYRFDYAKSRPNRFASAAGRTSVAVLLDQDVARVFRTAESVNAVLRAIVSTMPSSVR